MAAFYGESYRLDNTTLDWFAIRYHFDGLSETVSSGESFYVAAYADPLNLTESDEAVVSWVIETGPATSGAAFAITSGLDPDYAMNPAVVTDPVGSFTASGTQTIVSEPVAITVAELLAGDVEPTARIDVTAGTLEVLQVKLRAWPPGGAAGAWVSGNNWVRSDSATQRWYASIVGGTPQLPTYAEAWSALKDVVDAWDGTPDTEYAQVFDAPPLKSVFDIALQVGVPPFTPAGSASAGIALISASPPLPSVAPEHELAAGMDPNEVRQEQRAFIRAAGGAGPAAATFAGWEPDAAVTVGTGRLGAINLGDTPPALTAHPTNPDFRLGPFYYPSSWVEVVGDVPLSTLGGQHLALGVLAPLYFDGPPSADAVSGAGATISALVTYLSSIADYEWYDPTAVAQSPRFYVKDLDGDMRPVGFGKPATETAVFKIPTPMGRYRDLTTTEYATYGPDTRPPGGYPLKVKRVDTAGEPWWDHVAWLVPETD